MADQYAVIGNPIAHSKSPLIHTTFAQQTAQDITYERVLSPLDGFTKTVQDLMAQGYRGANVTVPFKFEAYALCDTLSARAQAAGAVNTLSFSAGKIIGDNTDGAGLARDIARYLGGAGLAGQNILLLGAGGAAQGVLLPLMLAKPAGITLANRTLEKAQTMAQKFAVAHPICNLAIRTFAQLASAAQSPAFDLIINATSAGLSDEPLPIPDAILTPKTLAYDMMYGRETPFMAQARAQGAQVADGLGMLVEQAAEAFYLWRAVRPQTTPVLEQLRAL